MEFVESVFRVDILHLAFGALGWFCGILISEDRVRQLGRRL